VISLENFERIDIYVDGSHATHMNMRSHTGGCIVMGSGVLHARSSKQGLNSKSSSESELIAASDYLPYALWLIYFYEKQGYKIVRKELKQDNQSTMRWLKNGKRSSGKQSRHVNIRFFWVADVLKKNHVSVEYCSTHRMLGDFFTKPLQGSLFRIMRDIVQGLRSIDDLKHHEEKMKGKVNKDNSKIESILLPCRKERVGKYEETKDVKRVRFVDFGNENEYEQIDEELRKSTYADVVRNAARKNIIN